MLDVELEAAPSMVPWRGSQRWALTYNGTTPGPTLRVRPGDRLRVTLRNRLDSPTNLHVHGLHVSPSANSDNVFVMINPGEEHTYDYLIPADHPSGTFWYHPHHHGTVAEQVAAGMAGVIIIEDELDTLPLIANATERVMLLSDPRIGTTSQVLQWSMMGMMQGRFGDGVLVNAVVNFLIVAWVVFILVKMVNKVKDAASGPKEAAAPEAPKGPTQEELLAEIRDLLKK